MQTGKLGEIIPRSFYPDSQKGYLGMAKFMELLHPPPTTQQQHVTCVFPIKKPPSIWEPYNIHVNFLLTTTTQYLLGHYVGFTERCLEKCFSSLSTLATGPSVSKICSGCLKVKI